MLQYDLTTTRLFDATSRAELPNEGEMFAVTVALLFVREAAYADLRECDLILTPTDVEEIALVIETNLSSFARDLGGPDRLRDRLSQFVGLRIGCTSVPTRTEGRAKR